MSDTNQDTAEQSASIRSEWLGEALRAHHSAVRAKDDAARVCRVADVFVRYVSTGVIPEAASAVPSGSAPAVPESQEDHRQSAEQDTADQRAILAALPESLREVLSQSWGLSSQSPVVGLDTATVAEPGADANSASGEG